MLAGERVPTILDVGGGHGQVTGALIATGARLTVHGSAEECGSRIRNFVDAGKCIFRVGDLLALPFEDQSYHTVVCYRQLAHVQQWERFLGELVRVSSCNVILDCPVKRSINCLAAGLFTIKRQLEGNTRPFRCFREREIVGFFCDRGFRLGGRVPQFVLPMVLHRTVNLPRFSRVCEGLLRILGLTGLLGSPVILKFVRR
jgi:2-polyprenyl-3-methyl-5-hydroxy-6-metoxy-1,4-benzoquinol methylase